MLENQLVTLKIPQDSSYPPGLTLIIWFEESYLSSFITISKTREDISSISYQVRWKLYQCWCSNGAENYSHWSQNEQLFIQDLLKCRHAYVQRNECGHYKTSFFFTYFISVIVLHIIFSNEHWEIYTFVSFCIFKIFLLLHFHEKNLMVIFNFGGI
jgi:hypothetical protein